MNDLGIKSKKSKSYYHMTALSNLCSISEKGLIPRNGENGRLIGEKKTKVYFSEGYEGAIALFVDFDIVYNKIKSGEQDVAIDINDKVRNSKNIRDYLGEGVYLQFDGSEIENERNFENGCTDQIISPEKINVCILREEKNQIIFSRFEVIKYMMANTNIDQIVYYGAKYEGSPDFEVATNRIQEKVKRYYKEHKEEIIRYNNPSYQIEVVPLNIFVKKYMKG